MIIMASITFILIYALWIPAQSNAGIIVFSALFGFTSGVIVGMAPALVAQISEIREVGVRTGTMFTFVAVAILVSNPIAGALVDANNGKYVYAQVFAGSVMAGGTILYIAARVSIGGWRVAVKV